MKKRIAILSSDDAHHRYLASLLKSRFDVVAHVVEPGKSQRARLLRGKRYVDYAAFLYHHVRRVALGLDAYRAGYFADQGAPTPRAAAAEALVVDWINEPAVIDLLRRARPDITVVICTSILRKEVLEAAGTVINVHGGHLPDYRGNHCFFFALYEGAFDKIGSTIHFVDPGIDTGDILEVVRPAIHADDSAETLYCRAEKLAIHRLVQWIEHAERGGTLPRTPQARRTRLHRTRDRLPHHDVLLWLRRQAKQLIVPERAAPPMTPIHEALRGDLDGRAEPSRVEVRPS